MKESRFIKKNLDSWKEYERVIGQKHLMPKKLSRLFVKITDDLSYAYTYYNNRSVRLYLNGIAKNLFNRVNSSERFRFARVKSFFTHSVPLAIYDARREFLVTFILFAVSMLIGIFSSKNDPDFAQFILGDDYVKMTQENIAKNDPMAVYKSMAPFDMFFAITVNNCLVALRTFVMGFFLAIGTIVIMIHNGIMVGTFQYFFVEHDMFKESFLTIWQHGVFEISSIIMSGAAGLVLGKGLVFPGNYTRSQSLRISARKGLKLMIGIIPILVIAGFIEGFYTRYTGAPESIRILTIIASLVFIIGYFIILPRRRGRQRTSIENEVESIEAVNNEKVSFDRIFTASEIFMISFQQLKNNLGRILKLVLLLSILYPILWSVLEKGLASDLFEELYDFRPIEFTVDKLQGILTLLVLFIVTSVFLTKVRLTSTIQSKAPTINTVNTLQIILMQVLVHLPLFIPSSFFAVLLYVTLLVYSTLVLSIFNSEEISIFGAISKSTNYLTGSFVKFVSIMIRYLVISILFYFAFMQLIVEMNNELLQMNIYDDMTNGYKVLYYVNMFYFSFMLLFSYAVFFVGNKTLYYSLHETITAQHLIDKINTIGNTKRIRGLIRE